MNIYMMRHGETEMNIERLLQGRIDSHLNEKGRADAVTAGEFLKEKGISPDIIWTSPLSRAKETTELATGIDKSLFVDEPLLIEMSFGAYEGRCVKDQTDAFNRDFFEHPDKCIMPHDAETFHQLLDRANELLDKLISYDDMMTERGEGEKNMLLTSHGALLHAVLADINNTPLCDFWKQKFKNCQIIRLVREGNRFVKTEVFFPGFDRGGLG